MEFEKEEMAQVCETGSMIREMAPNNTAVSVKAKPSVLQPILTNPRTVILCYHMSLRILILN
jgi:hypothetical protein